MRALSRCASSRKLWLTSAAGAIAALALAGTASADEVFSKTNVITLPGQNIQSFDISFVDPKIHRYVLGDRTNQQIDVIDTTTNTLLAPLKGGFVGFSGNNDTSGPDGVMIIDHSQVWVGDGPCPTGTGFPTPCAPVGTSSVKVLDFSGNLLHTIFTGGVNPGFAGVARSDELCYDPRDHLVMVANNADPTPYASLISTQTYTVVAQIAFDGSNNAPITNNGAEQCQWSNRTGKFYIAIPGIDGGIAGGGGVAVIDPKTKKVEKTFLISGNDCMAPQGVALGPDKQILLGCNGPSGNGNHSTVIINEDSGAIIQVLNNESGADEVWYNEGNGHYFLARGAAAGGVPMLGVVDAFRHNADQDVPTGDNEARNAHSVAAGDNQVYVPIPRGIGTVCGQSTANPPLVDTQGCIAVFRSTDDQRSASARERAADERQE